MRLESPLIAMAIGSVFAVGAGSVAAQTVVRIGHVAPLTGGVDHLGMRNEAVAILARDNEAGAILAVEDLNAKEIRIGGKKVRFELLSEDDGADVTKGLSAARKLVDSKVAGVIGHLNSGTTIPASRIYFDAGIPQISPAATHPTYTRQNFNTAFRVVADDAQLGRSLARYAVNVVKARSIAIIDDRSVYGQGIADAFRQSAVAAGAKVVGREFTDDGATDFEGILTRLKATRPDLLFFGGMDAVAGPMLRQMRQLGIHVKFMGGDGICSPNLAQLAGDAMSDGQVICAEAGGISKEKAPAMQAWRDRFKQRFNADVQIYAPYAYDATMTLAAAMQKADSTDPKKYLPALATIRHDGVTGRIAFDKKGDITGGMLTLFTYRGGKRELIAVVK